MTYLLPLDYAMSAEIFKRVVLAFDNTVAAAELLTGLSIDDYADLAEEDEDDPLVIAFFHALNPQFIGTDKRS